MEESFLASYQTTWMKQQLEAMKKPEGQWEPRLEKMSAFGTAIRKDGKYAFEWPKSYEVNDWDLEKKI